MDKSLLVFDENKHAYFYQGRKLISVTKLLTKHNLAPSYDDIDPVILERAAKKGSLVHKEIESLIKNGEIGFTEEVQNFYVAYKVNKQFEVLESEFKLFNEIVAGTADLLLKVNGILIIADIKTTAQIHYDTVSWQLSLYAYLYNLTAKEKCSSEIGQVLHFDKNGNLKIVDINLKPVEEVERLLKCEADGIQFEQKLSIPENKVNMLYEVEKKIQLVKESLSELEKVEKAMREALIKSMEENGIKSFENERIKLTYVAPTSKTIIDSNKLKENYPNIAEACSKISKQKASVRITLKEEK